MKQQNKILKEQAKGLKRQQHIYEHVSKKHEEDLAKLKAMTPQELKLELMNHKYYQEMFIEPSQMDETRYENILNSDENASHANEEDIHIYNHNNMSHQQQDEGMITKPNGSPMREASYNYINEDNEINIEENDDQNEQSEGNVDHSDAKSYQKAKDYVSYGYDYVKLEQNPSKVDVNLPLTDYVYQLL